MYSSVRDGAELQPPPESHGIGAEPWPKQILVQFWEVEWSFGGGGSEFTVHLLNESCGFFIMNKRPSLLLNSAAQNRLPWDGTLNHLKTCWVSVEMKVTTQVSWPFRLCYQDLRAKTRVSLCLCGVGITNIFPSVILKQGKLEQSQFGFNHTLLWVGLKTHPKMWILRQAGLQQRPHLLCPILSAIALTELGGGGRGRDVIFNCFLLLEALLIHISQRLTTSEVWGWIFLHWDQSFCYGLQSARGWTNLDRSQLPGWGIEISHLGWLHGTVQPDRFLTWYIECVMLSYPALQRTFLLAFILLSMKAWQNGAGWFHLSLSSVTCV